jgi:nucleoside-diphosphate-sugar epimerase
VNIFLTGINGFLGGQLAAHLAGRGHVVSGSARCPVRLPGAGRTFVMALGEPFDEAVFAGCEAVVHGAHDFSKGSGERNLAGTRAWFQAAARQGVRQQIFLSSYSSRAGSVSEYGRTKHALEPMFLEDGQTVLRPGLVIGPGGLFARQRSALLRTPVVPILGGGLAPTAVIGIGHFLEAVTLTIERRRTGAFNLFYEKQPTAREFVRAVRAAAGKRTRFLPVPTGVALALALAVRVLRLPIPVDPDQIRALAANQSAPWRSDLARLLPGRGREFTLEHALN